MKSLIVLLSLVSVSAHASYFATHCSNSTGSVKWEDGHNSNTMTLEYYHQGRQEKTISLSELKIKMDKEHLISEERVHECGYSSYTKVYAGKVTITPSESSPQSLDFMGENNKIQTEVICTRHINGRAPCPEKSAEE